MTDEMPSGESAVSVEAGEVTGNVEGTGSDPVVSEESLWEKSLQERPLSIKVGDKQKQIKTFAELKKYASLGNAAYDRMEEASKIKAEAEQIRDKYTKASLKDLLKERGLSGDSALDEIASLLESFQKEAEEDPRDRRLREYEERERKVKEEEEGKKTKKEQEEYQKTVEGYQEQLVQDIHAASTKLGMPETPFLLKQVALELENAWANKIDLSAEEAVRLVQEDFVTEYVPYLRSMDTDLLEKALGDDVVKALRKKWIGEAKKAEEPFATRKSDARQASQKAEPNPEVKSFDLSSKSRWARFITPN